LSIEGTTVTEGGIASGDPFSRSTPFDFAAGSGGSAVLTSVPVSVGDEIVLHLERTSASGDYVGVQWTVTDVLTGGPEVAAGKDLWLGPAAPNPVQEAASIPFRIPGAGLVTVEIYDIAGRVVVAPLEAVLPAGIHVVKWDGRDRSGRPVTGGLYFFRLAAGSQAATGKLTVLR
jgi:hypothetical protein